MGNSQSNAQGNTPNQYRLSKPKTNTNSPKTASPVSVCSRYADLGVTRIQHLKSQVASPTKSTCSSGYSYDGDDGMGELASQVQVRLSSLSRSNSVASQTGPSTSTRLSNLPASDVPPAARNQEVDLNTALKILQEVRKSASPADLAALHQALQTSPSPAPDQSPNARSSPVNRSTPSLTRRRSLITTPGLATRHSITESTRRSWNSWRSRNGGPPESKWKVDMMGSSPLRFGGLDVVEDDENTTRARTPGDMEYSHLGALKLGSLVVTNGAPSPAASTIKVSRRVSHSDLTQEDDYFTASEGTSSPTTWKSGRKWGHARSKSSVLPQTPPIHSEPRRSGRNKKKTKDLPRCASPLKILPTPDSPRSVRRSLHVVNKSADTLATVSIAEIPDSPLCSAELATGAEPRDEGLSEPCSYETPAYRAEAYRILDGTIFSEPDSTAEQYTLTPQTTHTVSHSSHASNRRRSRRPTPSTADSGYSSGGSFRTAQRDSRKVDPTHSSTANGVVAGMLRTESNPETVDKVSLYDFEQMMALSQKPLPPIPTNEIFPNAPTDLPEPLEQAVDSQLARMSWSEQSGPTRVATPSSPVRPQAETPAPSYQWSWERTTSFSKRLQKRRSSLPDLPVVQSCQPVEGTIPSVPEPVRAKFVRRLSDAPEMECLTRTYLSKDHTNAEEPTVDPPTTLSRESSNRVSLSLEPRPRHHRRSQSERPSTPTSGMRRTLSIFRSQSKTRKQKDDEEESLNVVDLGTVGAALGRSPYDIALSSHALNISVPATHPHQLGDALPRTRSMVGMDAQTATKFARLRSIERASRRPGMPQRPQSYHDVKSEWRGAEQYAPASRGKAPSVREFEGNTGLHSLDTCAVVDEETALDMTPTRLQLGIRTRSTGRGEVVAQLVEKYDKPASQLPRPDQEEWKAHALWRQRRKSMGEASRKEAEISPSSSSDRAQRASTEPLETSTACDRYGAASRYQGRGSEVNGSAGNHRLHNAPSRNRMQTQFKNQLNQFGLDLTDVPVLLQRMS